jgi:hypothetical protein
LVYGFEAILPADIMWDSPAVEQYDEGISDDSRRVDISGLEEARGASRVSDATTITTSRNAPSTLVISSSIASRTRKDYTSSWEGPFIVARVTGPGSYRLQTLEGDDISNSWNVDQLCRFYA